MITHHGAIVDVNAVSFIDHDPQLTAAEPFEIDRLEVSSPGMDRPLRKAADFVRFRGERAEVKLKVPLDGRKNFTGTLGMLADGLLALDSDGKMFAIELANVHKARLKPEF